jgi:hypothetical protein
LEQLLGVPVDGVVRPEHFLLVLALGAALAVVPLLAAALAGPDDPLGRVSRLLLIVGSCVTAGRLLAAGAPLRFLKAGVVAMAAIDAVLILLVVLGTLNKALHAREQNCPRLPLISHCSR